MRHTMLTVAGHTSHHKPCIISFHFVQLSTHHASFAAPSCQARRMTRPKLLSPRPLKHCSRHSDTLSAAAVSASSPSSSLPHHCKLLHPLASATNCCSCSSILLPPCLTACLLCTVHSRSFTLRYPHTCPSSPLSRSAAIHPSPSPAAAAGATGAAAAVAMFAARRRCGSESEGEGRMERERERQIRQVPSRARQRRQVVQG